jgi:hypothetical protein
MPVRSFIIEGPQIRIVPWLDVVVDRVGIDPRSSYAEHFWLALLGPSSLWLLRRLAAELDRGGDGVDIDAAEFARSLGLSASTGKNSPVMRTLTRLCQFNLARAHDSATLEVRRRIPPLTRAQVARLDAHAQGEHELWLRSQLHTHRDTDQRRRARAVALSLVQLGDDLETTERQLHRWRLHPALAHDAATWAWSQRHRVEEAVDVGLDPARS